MRLSRDESGESLAKKLSKVGYLVIRQKGSHIRLSRITENNEHHITRPNHSPIKIGLLSKILNDMAHHMDISRMELIEKIND
ncbi:MAG: type II toxin-antitoxin system HicA family toxin [Saprospiraceae bacterium]|nr:type II toxin-antitoxin system HicA family toxin [Saprospiraceae bacterium]MBK8854863.1 type II toxin-antitoxin system HicA family toxin [Saprospiraceae bacterium]